MSKQALTLQVILSKNSIEQPCWISRVRTIKSCDMYWRKCMIKFRFTFLLQIMLIVATLSLFACQQETPPEPVSTPIPGRCAATNVDDVKKIPIGVMVPLSQPGSVAGGQAMEVAFNIALEDINASGGILGKPVHIIIGDTRGTPEVGTDVAEHLIADECVVALVGEFHSAVGLTIMEVAHKYHTPVIFAETYSDDITASGYPEVFRIAPASTFTAQMDAKWLAEVGDYNVDGNITAVIVAENTDYGTGQIEKVKKWFPEFGITPEVIMVDLPINDFSAVIADIQKLATIPDAVFVKVTGETSYILERQIIKASVAPNNQTILVANQVALDHETYWSEVPDGNFVVVPRIGPWASTATVIGFQFAEKYREINDRWPEPYAFESYDSLMLMANAINRAGTLEPDAIIKALEESDVELASGRYTFPYRSDNPAGGFVPEFMWHQWQDVPLLFLQYTAPNQNSSEMEVIWPSMYRTVNMPIVRPN